MQELTMKEIEEVNGGMNDWTAGGIAIIGLGIAGTIATGGFGLAIGGAMLYLGYVKDMN